MNQPQAPRARLPAPGLRRQAPRGLVAAVLAATLVGHVGVAQTPATAAGGLSHRDALIATYDAILNADFDLAATRMAPACDETPVWCDVLRAVSIWWQIALDPDSRTHDTRFSTAAEQAIDAAGDWAEKSPGRAEAWFALGAAYGARAQWRVERGQRLAAARDGKHIKNALERALTLDPLLHDAHFGIGLYRYYAAVAPLGLRMFRWLLLLPGGDRRAGLQQLIDASEHGDVIRGEATYQLHLIYLWYEDRPRDALALIRELQQRYPRNPLFVISEARILDVYFHDVEASRTVLRALITRAESAEVNESTLAARRARALLRALDPSQSR